jgi:hypothetical protein
MEKRVTRIQHRPTILERHPLELRSGRDRRGGRLLDRVAIFPLGRGIGRGTGVRKPVLILVLVRYVRIEVRFPKLLLEFEL